MITHINLMEDTLLKKTKFQTEFTTNWFGLVGLGFTTRRTIHLKDVLTRPIFDMLFLRYKAINCYTILRMTN